MAPVGFENLHKLIVNYLPKTFTEQDISNLFSVFGKVHSCKLMIDLKTGESKGWCFVNYFNLEDAQKAVQSYNGLRMQDKVIRVSFAGEDANNKAQLFISGLKKDMTQEELLGIFSGYGKVTWCYIMPKGAALIRFENREEAEQAIEGLHNKQIQNNPYPLNVSFHESSRGSTKPKEEEINYSLKATSSTKAKLFQRYSPTAIPPKPQGVNNIVTLYVSGLQETCDEATLYKLFSPYGAIANATLMTDPETKKCKGVAFIDMVNRDEAIIAIQSLHGLPMGERTLKVAFKTSKKQKFSEQGHQMNKFEQVWQ